MTVLVTGGAGYLGSAVVRDLLDSGKQVVAVDNLYRGDYKHLSVYEGDSRLRMVVGDINSGQELNRCLEGVCDLTAIVHLAAVSGLEACRDEPERAVLTNVLGTFNVLELAKTYGARVVFASSAAVFGVPQVTPITEGHPLNPINLYGVTKLAGEKLVQAYNGNYGLSTIILRLGNLFGVGFFTYWDTVIPKFVKQGMEGDPLTIYGEGEQGRDFVHVLDVSKAVMSALDNEDVSGETFNLAGAVTVSVNTVAAIVSEVLKEEYSKKVKTARLPPRADEPYVEDFRYSIDKVKDALGFEPQWTVKEGVSQIARYYAETAHST